MNSNYFLSMIQNLRQQEEILLYQNLLVINENEIAEVREFLKNEYSQEALGYPGEAPAYDAEAALWAAKTIYVAAQLILYRENKEADLELLLPDFKGEINASSILSTDLCLRFLPQMLVQLKHIDSIDALIPVLEKTLNQWHYSGIDYPLNFENTDFTVIGTDKCLQQLYTDRIIANKNIHLARNAAFNELVRGNLGIFAHTFWNEFKIANTIHE